MAFTQDFRTQRRNYSDGETRIGEKDRLWYDPGTNSIRISDGVTPGGVIVGGAGGGGDYVLPTASASTKGGVKIGSNITITDGVISVAAPFSGSYTDLTNKPTIPTNTNQLTNGAGFITGYTETDPVFVAHAAYGVTSTKITNWDTAYGWGNHASAGYLTSVGTITALEWTASEFFPSAPATSTVTAGDGTVDINLETGIPGSTTSVNWAFTNQGTIEFPDGTTQTSAYTGDSSTTEALTIGTGLSGTSFNGSTAVTIALATGYGDTQNPYASKTANYVLAAPNGSSGAPTFRAIVAADIPTLNQNTTGSAATLTTSRNINGVAFNGSADITVTAAAGTLTGTTLNSTVVTSSLTSVGTLNGLTVSKSTSGTALSITASNAAPYGGTATWQFVGNGNIGGVGSWISFPNGSVQTTAYTGNAATVTNGVYTTDTGTVTNTMLAGSIANDKLANSSITINGSSTALGGSVTISTITGNAGTATKLATARAINGVDFDGSAAITVTAAAGTLTGNTLASGVTASSLTSVGTLTSLDSSGLVTLTYTGAGSVSTLSVNGYNSKGGTGYHDFLKATNGYGSATNPTKWFRINSVGTLQILNNAYDATVFSVTDAGFIAINASTSATDGVPVNNGIAMRENSYIFDDGNYHITAKTGQIWLNSNDGSAVSINQQMPSGITPGGLKVTGPVNAQSAYYGRTPWNSALDTEVTIDDYRFRISNQGGIFPQVISNTSGTKNSAWTVVAARSGSAVTQTGSTGTLVANNAWASLYTSGGMDSAGDAFVATLQDKNEGRIYRVTFMRSDNGSTTGYNIIAERLL